MLNFVNRPLFETESEKSSNAYGEFIKTSINTSSMIMKAADEHLEAVPSIRTLARLVGPSENYNAYNIGVSINYTDNKTPRILFKSSPDLKYDSEIYMIAFPFNGIVLPIPESKGNIGYSKGMISVSDSYSVKFNNKQYKKILYLVVSPNMNLFKGDENHEAKNFISIQLTSYAYNKKESEKANNSMSTKEVMTVNIPNPGMSNNDAEVSFESSIVTSIETSNQQIFTVYIKPEKPVANKGLTSKAFATASEKAKDFANKKSYNNSGKKQQGPKGKRK